MIKELFNSGNMFIMHMSMGPFNISPKNAHSLLNKSRLQTKCALILKRKKSNPLFSIAIYKFISISYTLNLY